MSKYAFTLLLLVSVNYFFSQKGISKENILPINTQDFQNIDSILSNKKLIGLGECTHGISEFTNMRHQLFQYLVEKLGYNTLFIEADYSACLRLNKYIHGANDTIQKAINELLYFAWTTEEMKSFVEWLRGYNLTNKANIQFVGCDISNTTLAINYRDSCMAVNILNYIDTLPNTKGIYIAHNGHIAIKNIKTQNGKSIVTTGYYLRKSLGVDYLSIAQTTNTGFFNAFTYKENTPYFTRCELKKANHQTLEHQLSKFKVPILIVNYNAIRNVSKLYYTSIGHSYGKINEKYTIQRYSYLSKNMFDYVIYFENTKETKSLKNE